MSGTHKYPTISFRISPREREERNRISGGIIFYSSSADNGRTGNGTDTERGRSNPSGSIRTFRYKSSVERADGNTAEDKEKLLSENEKLEKQQKKLQQEINKMVQSKDVMERNIHAYDEDVKWQLAEPWALVSAKNYRDKKALPLVERWKEVVKNLTIKYVQLTEQGKKLTAKVDGQQKQISRLTDKVMEQSDTIDRLQEKVSDLGRLERHFGREQVQLIWNGQRQ